MDASRTLNNSRGIAIVYIAFLLVGLIAIAGLVIDIGYMYVTKSQLQNAADAGALAGASKLNGSFTNYSAHFYAQQFASINKAAGQPVPSSLNFANYSGGDTVVGCWNGTFYSASVLNCTEANAVKVVARRTTESGPGISTDNKQVDIFLGRILGEEWKKMSTKAVAIAINQKAGVMPIAANEYWYQNAGSNRPYGENHNYPNSFVRTTNIGPLNPPSSTPNFGRVFAILGGNADNNNTPSDPGGFVALNYRNPTYDSSGQWYKVNTTVTTPVTCGTCSSGFSPVSPPSLNSSDVVAEAKYYLTHGGYDNNFILPTAVLEELRVSPAYPENYLSNPTSSCPYATVGYFSGSGSNPCNDTDFKVGDKIVTVVYDGRVENPGGGDPKNVTIVGYSLIQIDGYSSNNPRNLLNPNFFNGNKHTLYGHALDFVGPSSSGACDESMFLTLNLMRYRAGTPRLVK